MKIKLTCRKVAIKFMVLFCATFLPMWICCAVMALGGDIQGRNLFVIVSAFCILSLYHIISCYHQILILSEYEIMLKRGLETWRIRYEEVGRIIFHTQVSIPPFDKPDIFIRSPQTTIHFRENWFDDKEIFQRAMDTIYQRTPQVHVVKNGKGIDVNMYTFVSALKYMFIPFLMLVFLLSLLVS